MENKKFIEKTKARQRYKRIRAGISKVTNQLIFDKVVDFLINFKLGNNLIGIYWPIHGEVDLRGLKDYRNLALALPACNKKGEISYHKWLDNKLTKDAYGIPAPIFQPSLKAEEIELILVPALSIDINGIRLGYGGGCFDRLRSSPAWKGVKAYAVISEDCISRSLLPKDKWDIPLNGWINEKEIFQINN